MYAAQTTTEQRLAKLGFGCSGAWGMGWFSEKKAISLIEQAVAAGITHYDTGNFYCRGNAETRLGHALRNLPVAERSALRVSSKTGTQIGADGRLVKDFSRDTMRRDVETSLERLGIDALDILYLHGPNEHELAASLPLMAALKHEGLIRAIGVCSEGKHLRKACETPEVEAVMGSFNLLDSSHVEAFRIAKDAGKHIATIAPLAQGLYRKSLLLPRSLPDVWYLIRALVKNRSELQRARQQDWVHEIEGWDAPDLALSFVLHTSLVDATFFTTTKPAHLATNINVTERDMPIELYEEVMAHATMREST